jgi:hypothetical protein
MRYVNEERKQNEELREGTKRVRNNEITRKWIGKWQQKYMRGIREI